jgi:hypothetical protein
LYKGSLTLAKFFFEKSPVTTSKVVCTLTTLGDVTQLSPIFIESLKVAKASTASKKTHCCGCFFFIKKPLLMQ